MHIFILIRSPIYFSSYLVLHFSQIKINEYGNMQATYFPAEFAKNVFHYSYSGEEGRGAGDKGRLMDSLVIPGNLASTTLVVLLSTERV